MLVSLAYGFSRSWPLLLVVVLVVLLLFFAMSSWQAADHRSAPNHTKHTKKQIQMVEDFDVADCVHEVELDGRDTDAAFDGFVSRVRGEREGGVGTRDGGGFAKRWGVGRV